MKLDCQYLMSMIRHAVTSQYTSDTSGTVAPTCTDNSLRLANLVTSTSSNGLVTIEGHVEICLSGTYYAICDEGWDDRDAQVACRALTNNTGTYSMLQHYNSCFITVNIRVLYQNSIQDLKFWGEPSSIS